jgi:hypothetical protein
MIAIVLCCCGSTASQSNSALPTGDDTGRLSRPDYVLPGDAELPASEVLAATLEPGDRVISMDNSRKDIVTAQVKNGQHMRTVRMEKKEGRWRVVESPGPGR